MLQLGPYRSEWTALLPHAIVTARPELQWRAMSWSMVLLHPGSVLMSKASVTTKGHVDAQSLGTY